MAFPVRVRLPTTWPEANGLGVDAGSRGPAAFPLASGGGLALPFGVPRCHFPADGLFNTRLYRPRWNAGREREREGEREICTELRLALR